MPNEKKPREFPPGSDTLVDFDLQTRTITVVQRKPLLIEPVEVTLPVVFVKQIYHQLLSMEIQGEMMRAQQAAAPQASSLLKG